MLLSPPHLSLSRPINDEVEKDGNVTTEAAPGINMDTMEVFMGFLSKKKQHLISCSCPPDREEYKM